MAPFDRRGGSCRRRRQGGGVPDLPVRTAKEPVMRRWPHAAPAASPAASWETVEAELHSLGCALERQSRLLQEIQALLQSGGGPASQA